MKLCPDPPVFKVSKFKLPSSSLDPAQNGYAFTRC